MQTVLWGGPLDGCELEVPEPPQGDMVVPQFPGWDACDGAADVLEMQLIRHHYVFDEQSRRYNYAGDWPRPRPAGGTG